MFNNQHFSRVHYLLDVSRSASHGLLVSFSEHSANVDVILKLIFPEEETDNGEVKGWSQQSQSGRISYLDEGKWSISPLLAFWKINESCQNHKNKGQQNFYKGQGWVVYQAAGSGKIESSG